MYGGITARWTLALVTLSTLALAGCREGEPAEGERSSQQEERIEMGAPESAASAYLALTPKSETEVLGRVKLAYGMDSTIVDLTLTGLEPGTTYPAHIHVGNCEDPGAVVVALRSVVADSDGRGYSATSVSTGELERGERNSGQLLIQAHLPDGTAAACVTLPPEYAHTE